MGYPYKMITVGLLSKSSQSTNTRSRREGHNSRGNSSLPLGAVRPRVQSFFPLISTGPTFPANGIRLFPLRPVASATGTTQPLARW